MASQEQAAKQSTKTEAEEVAAEPADLVNEELADDVDAMLDEIDDVLETNAAEFVQDYVQRGGE